MDGLTHTKQLLNLLCIVENDSVKVAKIRHVVTKLHRIVFTIKFYVW